MHTQRHRRFTLFLATALVAAGLGGFRAEVAAAQDDGNAGGDNAAVAINTRDGSSLFRLAFKIRRVAGDIVDNQNAAVAYARCNSCQTTAIAIQIVFVLGSPSVVTPRNVAVAVNESCTLCETFASAYQFVIGTGGPVRFTADGNREIAAIKRELRALRHEDLTPFELQERVRALMQRLKVVLATQLRSAGPGDDEQADEEEGEEASDELDGDERPKASSSGQDTGGETVTTETTAPTTTETATTTTPTTGTETETAP